MTRTLDYRAPSAHCYECGSMEIKAVCHHCGRPMCADCSVSSEVGRRGTEFSDLGLDTVFARHCHDDDHTVDGGLRWLIVSGAILAVAGLFWLIASKWVGLGMIVAGLVAVALGLWFRHRRRALALHDRPPFPLVPKLESVTLAETIHGEIRLEPDGSYRTPAQPAAGRLTVTMSLRESDRDRLSHYRTKYNLTDQDPVPYSAGFLVLRGAIGLEFDDRRVPIPVIGLRGMVTDHPFLVTDGVRDRRYQIDLTHRPRPGSVIASLPFWLTPSIVADSDQRALELDLHWDEFGHENQPLELDRINELKLVLPIGCGDIRRITLDEGVRTRRRVFGRDVDPDDPDETVRTIQITGIRLPKAAVAARRVGLRVEFENKIETDGSIRGSFDALFRRAASGVSAVEIHHPLGGPRKSVKKSTDGPGRTIDISTRVITGISLSLAGLRYQDSRVVPDPKFATDDDKHSVDELRNVVPHYRTVAALTNALSAIGYYVKSVQEDPPKTGPRTNTVARYWDISGRHYESLFPVEFRIRLTGEEQYDGRHDPVDGTTSVAISVHGVYANQGMREKIERLWSDLRDQTLDALRATQLAGAGPSDDAYRWPEVPTPQRMAELRAMRDKAMRELLDGRISEETYRKIDAAVARELGE